MKAKIKPVGDKAVNIAFGQAITPAINAAIRNFVRIIEGAGKEYIEEVVPTYAAVLLYYKPELIDYKELCEFLHQSIEEKAVAGAEEKKRIVEIPVFYGGEYGPDIQFVASNNGLSEEEVIRMHSEKPYLVYMLGFMPGFTYLGGMNEKLRTPRLLKPRLEVPAGSVGIADMQTGIYPSASPGGWQLIGRTPVKIYDEKADPPTKINAGDYIKFVPVTKGEYDNIEESVASGTYEFKIMDSEGAADE